MSAETSSPKPDAESVTAFFVLDILTPLRKLHGIASKETWRKLRAQGLKTYKVTNLGICVRPSELKLFLDEQAIIE